MQNFLINEETLHYVARFLERWADKAPNKEHEKHTKKMRELSDHLIDNLYNPMLVSILRKSKKND